MQQAHLSVHLPSFIDGAPLDIITLLVAIIVALAKCYRHKHFIISKEMGFNVVHGIAIFPLFVLSFSVFNKELYLELGEVKLLDPFGGWISSASVHS